MWSLNDVFNDLAKNERRCKVAGNHEYKETDSLK